MIDNLVLLMTLSATAYVVVRAIVAERRGSEMASWARSRSGGQTAAPPPRP